MDLMEVITELQGEMLKGTGGNVWGNEKYFVSLHRV